LELELLQLEELLSLAHQLPLLRLEQDYQRVWRLEQVMFGRL
jgi:hypothetical protein